MGDVCGTRSEKQDAQPSANRQSSTDTWQSRLEYGEDVRLRRPTMLQQQAQGGIVPPWKAKAPPAHEPDARSSSGTWEALALGGKHSEVQPEQSRSSLIRAPLPTKDPRVYVHIYSLGTAGQGQALNSVLRVLGTGAFHCGVEVYGKEWSFRGRCCSGTGVFASRPQNCEHHTYSETLTLGETSLTGPEVSRLLSILQREWPGTSYDTLRRNCCHFSDKFCRCLGVGSLPPSLTSLANAGVKLVEAGNAIDTHRKSLSSFFSLDSFICNGVPDRDTKVVEYDAPGEGW